MGGPPPISPRFRTPRQLPRQRTGEGDRIKKDLVPYRVAATAAWPGGGHLERGCFADPSPIFQRVRRARPFGAHDPLPNFLGLRFRRGVGRIEYADLRGPGVSQQMLQQHTGESTRSTRAGERYARSPLARGSRREQSVDQRGAAHGTRPTSTHMWRSRVPADPPQRSGVTRSARRCRPYPGKPSSSRVRAGQVRHSVTRGDDRNRQIPQRGGGPLVRASATTALSGTARAHHHHTVVRPSCRDDGAPLYSAGYGAPEGRVATPSRGCLLFWRAAPYPLPSVLDPVFRT